MKPSIYFSQISNCVSMNGLVILFLSRILFKKVEKASVRDVSWILSQKEQGSLHLCSQAHFVDFISYTYNYNA